MPGDQCIGGLGRAGAEDPRAAHQILRQVICLTNLGRTLHSTRPARVDGRPSSISMRLRMPPRAVDPAFYRADLAAADLGDLLVGRAVDGHQNQDHAVRCGLSSGRRVA